MKNGNWLMLMLLFSSSCAGVYKREEAKQLSPDAYQMLMRDLPDAHRLDIRTGLEYRRGHIPGFRNINYLSISFQKRIDSLDRSKPVFIYCQTAHRSPFVAKALLDKGFHSIIDLKGGYKNYLEWKSEEKSDTTDTIE